MADCTVAFYTQTQKPQINIFCPYSSGIGGSGAGFGVGTARKVGFMGHARGMCIMLYISQAACVHYYPRIGLV